MTTLHSAGGFKKLALLAYDQIIEKFMTPDGRRFDVPSECPMCQIYLRKFNTSFGICMGCPFADSEGDIGCADFKNINDLRIITGEFGRYTKGDYKHSDHIEYFHDIAELLRQQRGVLEEKPQEYFHPLFWKEFTEFSNFKETRNGTE